MKQRILFLVLLSFVVKETFSQKRNSFQVSKENWSSAKIIIIGECENIIYPSSYKRRFEKWDRKFVREIEVMMDHTFEYLKQAKLNKFLKNEIIHYNGIIKIARRLYSIGNLKVKYLVESIGGYVTRKQLKIETRTSIRCDGFRTIDFNYLDLLDLDTLNITWSANQFEIEKDSIYLENINQLTGLYPDFQFRLPFDDSTGITTSAWINQYRASEACCYEISKPPKEFKVLTSETNIEVLKALLFSPNYFYSLNAMEALVYLNLLRKVELTDSETAKINEIKNKDHFIINQVSSDVFARLGSYKELNMTDEKIIEKYN